MQHFDRSFRDKRLPDKLAGRLRRYAEGIFWVAALIALGCLDPVDNSHFSLCVFKLAGLGSCPGCGLGRSMAYFLHGHIASSLQTHPLGIFGVCVIIHRIYALAIVYFSPGRTKKSKSKTFPSCTLFY